MFWSLTDKASWVFGLSTSLNGDCSSSKKEWISSRWLSYLFPDSQLIFLNLANKACAHSQRNRKRRHSPAPSTEPTIGLVIGYDEWYGLMMKVIEVRLVLHWFVNRIRAIASKLRAWGKYTWISGLPERLGGTQIHPGGRTNQMLRGSYKTLCEAAYEKREPAFSRLRSR